MTARLMRASEARLPACCKTGACACQPEDDDDDDDGDDGDDVLLLFFFGFFLCRCRLTLASKGLEKGVVVKAGAEQHDASWTGPAGEE